MTVKDKKKLLVVLGVVFAIVLLYRAVDAVFISPAVTLQRDSRALQESVTKLTRENGRIKGINQRLAEYYGRTFSTDESKVGEEMRARLMELMAPSGLAAQQLTSSTVSPRLIASGAKSKDKEISRTMTINGAKLAHIVNLLYLLDSETHVHRLETLSLIPLSDGKMNVQFKYSTLALEAPKAGARPTTSAATEPAGSLDTAQREQYEVIALRDMFRPYVARPPVARVDPTPERPAETPQPRISESQDSRLRVTGLPTLFGKDYVYVRNTGSNETRTYKPGDQWGDAKVVMVDCRPMPRKGNPREFTDSRVILRIGQDYWAVELGDTLADKHRVTTAELPPSLQKPASAPASRPTTVPATTRPASAPATTVPATTPASARATTAPAEATTRAAS